MVAKKVRKAINKVMPKPLKPNNLLKNKFVLYVTAILSVLNVVKFIFKSEFEFLFLFVLLALISSNFSKNMIINLLTAIVGTNLVYLIANDKRIHLKALLLKEGFEGKESGEDAKGDAEDKDKKKHESEKHEGDEEKKPGCHKLGEDGKWTLDSEKDEKSCSGDKYKWCVEGSCEKEDFSNSDIPTSQPASLEDKTVDVKSTVEQSYDNLEKLIGGDNIKQLTGDTKKLMDQQQNLVASLKSIGPVLEQSSKIMKGLPIDQMTKMLSSLKH